MPPWHVLLQKLTILTLLVYLGTGRRASVYAVVLTNAVLAHVYILHNHDRVCQYVTAEWMDVRQPQIWIFAWHTAIHWLPLLLLPKRPFDVREAPGVVVLLCAYGAAVDLGAIYPMFGLRHSRCLVEYAATYAVMSALLAVGPHARA
jgi:hypothetical protein